MRVPLILVTAGALLLAGCSSSSGPTTDATSEVAPGYLAKADASAASAGTLHLQLDYDMAEAAGLDPAGAQLARGWQIPRLVYDTLVDVGPNFEIVPRLAESFEQVSDTEYTFKLRDAKFSNGRAVTTDDVVGSLQRLIDAKTVWSFQLGPVSSIQAVDDRTVSIKLDAAYTPFLAALANTPTAILPMAEINSGELDPSTTMLGSGPFTVSDHRQDESWKLERNPNYWGADTLGIDGVDISFVADDQTRLAGLRDGSVEFANFTNPDTLDLLSNVPDARAVNQTQSDFFYVSMNSVNPASPFTDQGLRQAVNSAIDRTQLADLALGGQSTPTGVTPAPLPGACNPAELPMVGGDTSALKGKSIEMLIYNDDPALTNIAQVLQQQLQKAGADVKIQSLDYASFVERVFTSKPGDFQMALGWFAGYADPSAVTGWWNPDTAGFDTGFAQSHDDLNEAIVTASGLPNGDARTDALGSVCKLVDTYSEMVPLVTRPSVVAYRSDLLSPTLLSDEGYGDFLRNISEFRLTGTPAS